MPSPAAPALPSVRFRSSRRRPAHHWLITAASRWQPTVSYYSADLVRLPSTTRAIAPSCACAPACADNGAYASARAHASAKRVHRAFGCSIPQRQVLARFGESRCHGRTRTASPARAPSPPCRLPLLQGRADGHRSHSHRLCCRPHAIKLRDSRGLRLRVRAAQRHGLARPPAEQSAAARRRCEAL